MEEMITFSIELKTALVWNPLKGFKIGSLNQEFNQYPCSEQLTFEKASKNK